MMIKCHNCLHEWTNVTGTFFPKCPQCDNVIVCPSASRNKLHEILKDIVEAWGEQILSDKVRLIGIMADVSPFSLEKIYICPFFLIQINNIFAL